MEFPRRSGIILHPTSLPGRYGIGDLGREAFQFVDFLARAGQTYWQVLPLSPTGYGDSPYQGLSAFAGNPMLISPDDLVARGHLTPEDVASMPPFPRERVDFGWVIDVKTRLLDQAYTRFRARRSAETEFDAFCAAQAHWLDDLALFMALKQHYALKPWHEWEPGIKHREPNAVDTWREKLADEITRQKYLQWIFFDQWLALKTYANAQGVQIIGDIPIFVAYDSADVWANTDVFHLDEELAPEVVSGVPPDYFSATGQLWGHPHYRWDVMAENNYAWWIDRFRMAQTQADIIRIDHFRGFYDYWEVPAGAETAIDGRWLYGPGIPFFKVVQAALGEVPIIAEDLGDFDDESRAGVDAIQHAFGYPGMKVLQFGFDGPENQFLPHNYTSDFVAYTGTHDNATALGWYTEASEKERDYARRYMQVSGHDIAWDMIRLVWASVADTAMTTVQDLLSLGNSAKMNTPGTVGPPNWCWRMTAGALNDSIAYRLRELTGLYGRLPQ